MSIQELRVIIANGGGLILSAEGFKAEHLRVLAANSQNSGASLILRDVAHLTAEEMRGIGANGKGNVIFDLTS